MQLHLPVVIGLMVAALANGMVPRMAYERLRSEYLSAA